MFANIKLGGSWEMSIESLTIEHKLMGISIICFLGSAVCPVELTFLTATVLTGVFKLLNLQIHSSVCLVGLNFYQLAIAIATSSYCLILTLQEVISLPYFHPYFLLEIVTCKTLIQLMTVHILQLVHNCM